MRSSRALLALLPMAGFLLVFFYAPFAVLAYYSLQTPGGLGLDNYVAIISDPAYLKVAARSLLLALETVALTLLASYPAAVYTALYASGRERNILLGLFIIPFWVDVLLRTIALRTLLYSIGIGQGYLAMLLGMAYDYLPLMFLPLYAALRAVPRSVVDAARTMGAGWVELLRRVLLPLSLPGIAAGGVLVFLMSVTEFVIPYLLGGVQGFTIGSVIYYTFLSGGLWGVGAALTVVVVLVLTLAAMRVPLRLVEDEG